MSTPETLISILLRTIDIVEPSVRLHDRMKMITDIVADGLGVHTCRIYTGTNGEKMSLIAVNSKGYSGEGVSGYMAGYRLVERCAGWKSPIVIEDIGSADVERLSLMDETGRFSSVAAFPLCERADLYGVMYLAGEMPRRYTDPEMMAVDGVSKLIAAVLRDEKLRSEARKKVREFSILYDISTAMMTTIKLDRLLYNILTAVTIGDGLGFNRAILFLVNERSNIIQGMTGVGPDTYEDAWKIWNEFSVKGSRLLEIISLQGKGWTPPASRLNELVRSIRLPLNSTCVVARTVREQRPFNIKEEDGEEAVSPELTEKLGLTSFASVPLLASGKVVGAIIVDNFFNKREITEEDMQFLSMFAAQAGLAIENSLLYSDLNEAHLELKETHERLSQAEKLAALGEMAANVAHEIRNPLTSIGGFARRLHRRLEEDTEKKYAEIILKEVERLEHLLTDVLAFSREGLSKSSEMVNVNGIIDATLMQLSDELKRDGIQVVLKLDKELPKVCCDSPKMKQVFINLFTNSIQAMKEKGTLTIETGLKLENGRRYVFIAITDTGGGISEKMLPNIFNPFFTTKDTGTGLGLSITHRIVVAHQGDIDIINRPGEGVTFVVTLPVVNEQSKEEAV